jgi:hypothetical protein
LQKAVENVWCLAYALSHAVPEFKPSGVKMLFLTIAIERFSFKQWEIHGRKGSVE